MMGRRPGLVSHYVLHPPFLPRPAFGDCKEPEKGRRTDDRDEVSNRREAPPRAGRRVMVGVEGRFMTED